MLANDVIERPEMDWVPIVFGTFKGVALCIAMFFAVKWHYDQGEKLERRAALISGAKITAVFLLAVATVSLIAFGLSWKLGLDLSY